MENELIRWLLGLLSAGIAAMLGLIYKRTTANEQRLNNHDIMFARISELPAKFDAHEKEERIVFKEINDKLYDVKIQMAGIRKIMNGDK